MGSTVGQAWSHLDEQAGYTGKRGRHDDKTCATRNSGQIGRNDGLLIPQFQDYSSIEQSYWNQKLTTGENCRSSMMKTTKSWSMMFTAF